MLSFLSDGIGLWELLFPTTADRAAREDARGSGESSDAIASWRWYRWLWIRVYNEVITKQKYSRFI